MRATVNTAAGSKMVLHLCTKPFPSGCDHCGTKPEQGMWTDDASAWAKPTEPFVRCVDVKPEPSPLARITRRNLFEQVDAALAEGSPGGRASDPIWLLGAVVLLREVTKEDALHVAQLHEATK